MRSKPYYLLMLMTISAVILSQNYFSPKATTAAPDLLSGHYTLMGYEGVGTLGENSAANGQTPPVGDYVTTHCRYIDVSPLNLRESYLRYFLHLPDGATMTQIEAHVADFAEIGSIGIELMTRPWNSREAGTFQGSAGSDLGAPGDTTLTIIPNPPVVIDNQVNQYWLNVYFNQQTVPGQLCVYGIQATYTYEGGFLPVIRKGG